MAEKIYELKIQLDNVSKPPIWRKIEVNSDTTLHDLHDIIQTAMGWYNCHLWQFMVGDIRFGPLLDDDDWSDFEDATKISIEQALIKKGSKIKYEYDFGDGWMHTITLESINETINGRTYPYLLDGKGACPPEDCGGPWGYESLKETLTDPDSEDYEDMCEWLDLEDGSEFDPKEFDVEEVREMLK
jgi:hypothetical protein